MVLRLASQVGHDERFLRLDWRVAAWPLLVIAATGRSALAARGDIGCE
jgi:hypothetical protein